jgi:serine/threonine protein kinase
MHDSQQPLASIAHHTITAKLGEGGMGVALKLLPDGLTTDPSWRTRSQREAQMLAALNHPNIAAVYGLEDQAIIMELVEGPTLGNVCVPAS